VAVQRQRRLWLRLIVANPTDIDYSPGRSRRRRERGGRRRDADAMHFCLRYGCFLVDYVLLKGELRIYPDVDPFDIYDGPSHEAVVADEIEFLHRHLLGRRLCGTTKAASELPRVYLPPALTSGGNPVDEGVATATNVTPGISQE